MDTEAKEELDKFMDKMRKKHGQRSTVERRVMCKECIKAQVLLGLAMEAARGRLIDWTNKQHDGLFDEIEKYLKEHETGMISA